MVEHCQYDTVVPINLCMTDGAADGSGSGYYADIPVSSF